MSRLTFVLFLLAIILVAKISFAQVANKKLTGQSFKGELTISANPQTVWTALTNVQKLSKAMGFEYQGAAKELEKVGDKAQVKVWGDTGTLILTYAKAMSELRFTWEPDNASYICQERWVLTPAGNSTRVAIEERYTESGPQTPEEIAAQVKSFNEALARLKDICERKG